MTTSMQSNWGSTKGEAASGVNYFKPAAGRNHIRIVGDILRRYVYWLENTDGKKLSFENLDFNPESESFENGKNYIKELGIQSKTYQGELEFNDDGSPKPISSKKSYLVPVVNRATNQVEYMELKKGVFDGINEIMAKVNDARTKRKFVNTEYSVPNPSFIDVIFHKTGKGINTEYKVDIIDTLDMVQDEEMFETMLGNHQNDAKLLDDLKPIKEVFPRQSYDTQKANVDKFLAGKPKKEEAKSSGNTSTGSDFTKYDDEAMNELDA